MILQAVLFRFNIDIISIISNTEKPVFFKKSSKCFCLRKLSTLFSEAKYLLDYIYLYKKIFPLLNYCMAVLGHLYI